MTHLPVAIGRPGNPDFLVGPDQPLLLIGGPCVLESEELARRVTSSMQQICDELGFSYVFKASFDKANRTSISSYRGPGIDRGLEILARIREQMQAGSCQKWALLWGLGPQCPMDSWRAQLLRLWPISFAWAVTGMYSPGTFQLPTKEQLNIIIGTDARGW